MCACVGMYVQLLVSTFPRQSLLIPQDETLCSPVPGVSCRAKTVKLEDLALRDISAGWILLSQLVLLRDSLSVLCSTNLLPIYFIFNWLKQKQQQINTADDVQTC